MIYPWIFKMPVGLIARIAKFKESDFILTLREKANSHDNAKTDAVDTTAFIAPVATR
jgi:hypothetical protein